MYRPSSQATRRRSNEIRDLQSKSKKLSNKRYKEYVKRLIQNNPNHMDNQKRLKIQTLSTNRNELKQTKQTKQRIQRKSGDDQKQMFRSGVVRFIKPKLKERDYRRFKKLLQISNKIQKTRQQILNLTFLSAKYIKQTSSLFQNEKLRELKDILLKLQLQEQKLLIQIQQEGKQNKINRLFSLQNLQLQKAPSIYHQQNKLIQKRFEDLQLNLEKDSTRTDEAQNLFVNQNVKDSPNIRHRTSPQLNKESLTNQQQASYLNQLYDFILSLDGKKDVKKGDNSKHKQEKDVKKNENYKLKQEKAIQKLYQDIKSFLLTKQKTIDQLFVSLTNLNNINHKQNQAKSSSQDNLVNFQKFHDLQTKSRNPNINQQQQQQHTKYTSFKSLFKQIEKDLTQFKNLSGIRQRNNELAKKLLTTSRELQLSQEQKVNIQKALELMKQQLDFCLVQKKLNQSLSDKNQRLQCQLKLAKRELDQQNKIEVSHNKQVQKNEKYYRYSLTLQQQMRILSQQNQKLVQQTKTFKNNQQKNSQNQMKQIKQDKQKETHDKSTKQCPTNSLIYKEFEKKNKKLYQQNQMLNQQMKQLKQQTKQLQQLKKDLELQLQKAREDYRALSQEKRAMNEDSRLSQDQKKALIEQNIKIQEQFEYIVKEKLKLQSQLDQKSQKLCNINLKYQNLRQKHTFAFQQLQQIVSDLRQDKQFLSVQVQKLKSCLKQNIQSISQEVSSAVITYLNSFQKQQQHTVRSQSQTKGQILIDQGLQKNQYRHFQQQYLILQNQLNHCIYQLNSYKDMFSQVQIEKQLQKSYFQQDYNSIKLKLSLLQKQNLSLNKQLDKLQLQYLQRDVDSQKFNPLNQNQQLKDNKHCQTQNILMDILTQTQDFSTKRITSNIYSIACQVQSPLKTNDEKNIKLLEMVKNTISWTYQNLQKNKNFKINSELLGVICKPKIQSKRQLEQQQTQTIRLADQHLGINARVYQIRHICSTPQSREDDYEDQMNFQDWIQQIKMDPQVQRESFSSFCQDNLNKQAVEGPITMTKQQMSNQLSRLKQENRRLSQQIVNQAGSNTRPYNQQIYSNESAVEIILSPNDKTYTKIGNQQQMDKNHMRIVGSLYNKYNFPRLQQTQSHQQQVQLCRIQTRQCTSQAYQSQVEMQSYALQAYSNQKYPTLQQHSIQRQNLTINGRLQPDNPFPIQNKLYLQPNEDQDQSFDLCII